MILAMLTLLPVRTRLIHLRGSSWLVGAARGAQNGGSARGYQSSSYRWAANSSGQAGGRPYVYASLALDLNARYCRRPGVAPVERARMGIPRVRVSRAQLVAAIPQPALLGLATGCVAAGLPRLRRRAALRNRSPGCPTGSAGFRALSGDDPGAWPGEPAERGSIGIGRDGWTSEPTASGVVALGQHRKQQLRHRASGTVTLAGARRRLCP